MSPEWVGIIFVVLFVIIILLRAQVGPSLLLIGLIGYMVLRSPEVAFTQLGMSTFNFAGNYTLSVIPLFVLMGLFLSYSGLSQDLYKAMDLIVGRVRGGLAMATIGASAVFSSISGSAMSTTATMARVSLPEMKKYNYDAGLASASIAAGGTLGLLIPPSVTLILYGVLTMEPIGPLLIAGIIPGILLTIVFMLTIYVQLCLNPKLAPTRSERTSLKTKIKALGTIWPFLIIFILSIGGIYFGFFTPTEAAGIGASGALIVTILTRRIDWKRFVGALDESVRVTAMMFIILIGANLFSNFLAISRLPMTISTYIAELDVSKYTVLFIILVIYFILGMFMEGIAIQVLTLPIVYPIITGVGFDGVWFAVIFVMVTTIGLLTPPLGMNVYVIHGIDRSIPLQTIFISVIPMVIAMILFTILLIIFPEIVTYLPSKVNQSL